MNIDITKILKKQFLLFNDINNYNKYINFILDNNYIIYEIRKTCFKDTKDKQC